MISSVRERCGVADYTRDLVKDLGRLADVGLSRYPDVMDGADCGRLLGRLEGEADVLHIQYHPDFFGSWRTPRRALAFMSFVRRAPVPVVITVHDCFHPDADAAKSRRSGLRKAIFDSVIAPLMGKTRWGRLASGGFLGRAGHLIVHSAAMQETMQRFGVAAEAISILHPGIPVLPEGAGPSIRRQWDIGDDRRIVTVFGFVRPQKGLEAVLGAIAKVPEAFLLIAGGAPDRSGEPYVEQLRSLAQSLRIADRVRVTGYLSSQAAAAALKGSDAILLPYPRALTSASYALSYAAAANRPLVLSDNPYFVEMQQCYDAFALFEAGDPDSLAGALKDVLGRHAEREGARRFRAAESWTAVAAKTLAIYRRVLAR